MATLVTGGSGVIGTEVTRLLLERGEDRPGIFDLNPSPHRLGDLAERVDVVRGDLGTFSNVLDAVKRAKPTAIYHLGGMFSLPCEADPPAAVRVNALGTFHVLEAARLFDVPQVLFASSLATYNLGLRDGPIDDATLQRPAFLYGATKLFGEHLGLFYRRKYGLDFRGLRYPAVVAPGVTTPGAATVPLVGDRGQCQRPVLHNHGRAGDALPCHVREGRRAGDRGAGRCPTRTDPDGHLSPGWDISRTECRRTRGPAPDPRAWCPDRVPSRSRPPTTHGFDGSPPCRRQRAHRVGMAPRLRP